MERQKLYREGRRGERRRTTWEEMKTHKFRRAPLSSQRIAAQGVNSAAGDQSSLLICPQKCIFCSSSCTVGSRLNQSRSTHCQNQCLCGTCLMFVHPLFEINHILFRRRPLIDPFHRVCSRRCGKRRACSCRCASLGLKWGGGGRHGGVGRKTEHFTLIQTSEKLSPSTPAPYTHLFFLPSCHLASAVPN